MEKHETNVGNDTQNQNEVEILSELSDGEVSIGQISERERLREDYSDHYKPLTDDAGANEVCSLLLASGQAYKKKANKKKKIALIAGVCCALLVLGGLCGYAAARAEIRKATQKGLNELSQLYTDYSAKQEPGVTQTRAPRPRAESTTAAPAATAAPTSAVPTTALPAISLPEAMVSAAPAPTVKTAKDIYNDAAASVVGVTARVNIENSLFGQSYVSESKGSGFIATAEGYILTNYHVVEGGDSFTVSLFDGSTRSAELVGYDDTVDLAVLKADTAGFSPVSLGQSASLAVGDAILIIGNPLGMLDYSLTNGVVSALNRLLADDSTALRMFQTNAAVNSGNSGGPVFNMDGEVVGIVTAKYAENSVEGLSFCIPIDSVLQAAADIIQYGYARTRPMLSVSVQTLSATTASRYRLVPGVYVVDLATGGSAARAGLRQGDVITEINNTSISSVAELRTALLTCSAGAQIPVKVFRDGGYLDAVLTADEKTPQASRTGYSNVYDL